MRLQSLGRALRVIPVALSILGVGISQPISTVPRQPSHPLVGFTYVPESVAWLGLDPTTSLAQLVRRLHPDLVRIPVYWEDVAPSSGKLDFSSVDKLLATIEQANGRRHLGATKVILVVGARNLGWPEVHLPAWADSPSSLDLAAVTATPEYQAYLEQTFNHFARNRLLYAWQIENEPLDDTNQQLGTVSLDGGLVRSEVSLLKSIDLGHQVVVTTYDSATLGLDMQATSSLRWLFNLLPGPKPVGHPAPALQLGDVLGLDVYVSTPSTNLADATVQERINWKATALAYWSGQAQESGKEVWITEMQSAPWEGYTDGFDQSDLIESARMYAGTGVGAVLFWGVENWLSSPDWMLAGEAAMATLRS